MPNNKEKEDAVPHFSDEGFREYVKWEYPMTYKLLVFLEKNSTRATSEELIKETAKSIKDNMGKTHVLSIDHEVAHEVAESASSCEEPSN